MTTTILVTGANRGLGLEFVRQYAIDNNPIFACCRYPNQATELQALQQSYPNIEIHKLDITSAEEIAALRVKITQPIDLLINNAGMLNKSAPLGNLPLADLTETFLVNAVAPLKVTEAFIDHVAKSKLKLVVCISSSMGSITDNTSGGYYSYRAGKTALNMLMKSAAIDLQQQGIKILLLHPGWVKTRMGGEKALITPQESIAGMRQVIDSYAPLPGELRFYRYNGEIIPW